MVNTFLTEPKFKRALLFSLPRSNATQRCVLLCLCSMTLIIDLAHLCMPCCTPSNQAVAQQHGESIWKRTRYGWSDSTLWQRPHQTNDARRIERVHPVVFAGLMVLLALQAMIWATEEDQWAQVLRSSTSGRGFERLNPERESSANIDAKIGES